jgi:hypothetical protein
MVWNYQESFGAVSSCFRRKIVSYAININILQWLRKNRNIFFRFTNVNEKGCFISSDDKSFLAFAHTVRTGCIKYTAAFMAISKLSDLITTAKFVPPLLLLDRNTKQAILVCLSGQLEHFNYLI